MTVSLRIPPEKIILYGRSVGSGPTCYLAHRLAHVISSSRSSSRSSENGSSESTTNIAGVILYAPFTSVFRIFTPPSSFTMLGDPFPNIDRIELVAKAFPLMVIHGESDQVVPFSHGKALVDAAQKAVSDISETSADEDSPATAEKDTDGAKSDDEKKDNDPPAAAAVLSIGNGESNGHASISHSSKRKKNAVAFFHRQAFGHNDVPTLIGMEMMHAKKQFIQHILS